MTRILLSATLAMSGLAAQEPPARLFVAGIVTSSTNGDPVRKARVILRAKEETAFSYTADSDANGRFVIQDMLPGDYLIFAGRQGFMTDDNRRTGLPSSQPESRSGAIRKRFQDQADPARRHHGPGAG